jgi:hypothetical protein
LLVINGKGLPTWANLNLNLNLNLISLVCISVVQTKTDEEKRDMLTGIYHDKVPVETINSLVYFDDSIIINGDDKMGIELRTVAAKMKDIQVRHNEATEK